MQGRRSRQTKSELQRLDLLKVGLAIIGLVENVKLLADQPHTAKAVGAIRAVGALNQVLAIHAALASLQVS